MALLYYLPDTGHSLTAMDLTNDHASAFRPMGCRYRGYRAAPAGAALWPQAADRMATRPPTLHGTGMGNRLMGKARRMHPGREATSHGTRDAKNTKRFCS